MQAHQPSQLWHASQNTESAQNQQLASPKDATLRGVISVLLELTNGAVKWGPRDNNT